MALPVTIASILVTGGFAGPFKSSAGDYFFLCRNTTTPAVIRAYRATIPDVAWASIAASVTIPNVSTATTTGYHSIDAVQDGDILHIATVDADVTTATSTRVYYHKFAMSAGASSVFTLSNELVDGPTATSATTGGDFRSIAIIRRSASVVIAYQLPQLLYMSANYSRVGYRERTDAAGTWGAAVAVDAIGAAGTTANHITAVKDPQSDRIHFFWIEAANLRVRTLSAANAFNTAASVTGQAASNANAIKAFTGAAAIVGGVSKVVFCQNALTGAILSLRFDSADNPTVTSATSGTYSEGLHTTNNRVFTDDGKFYYLNSGTTSLDLLGSTSTDNGATWSARTVLFTAAIATAANQYLSTNGGTVYARGLNYVVPYIVNDAGTVKYNEYNVRALPSTTDAWNLQDASSSIVLSNSDKTASGPSGNAVRSTAMHASGTAGKYYSEFLISSAAVGGNVGIKTKQSVLATGTTEILRVAGSDGSIYDGGSAIGSVGGGLTTGDIICLAWDSGSKQIWFRKNGGLWNNNGSADPAAASGGFSAASLLSVDCCLWFMGATGPVTATIRTEAAEVTQSVPSGFLSWMGEAIGPSEINVSGAQTTLAVTQSATAAVDLQVSAAQSTAEAATAGTIQATEARNVDAAQTLDATTQTSAVALLAKVTTGAQGTSATTQTSAVAAGLAVTGAQTLTPVTPTSGVKVGLAVTGAQNTNAATTVADADAIATGTAAQTLAATTQSSGITLGPASFAVTGNQTLSATTQVFTASVGAAFVTVTGAQTTEAATTSAAAKALASVTGAQNTNAVTQSLIGDVDLAVTGSQALSPPATSATVKLLAAVTGSQTLSAPGSSATAAALAKVTTGAQTTLATTQSATATAPPALSVTGAQTTRETTQILSASLGAPFLTVTGDQQTSAATTSATATAALKVTTGAQTLSATVSAANADVDVQVTGAQALQGAATAGSIALVPFGAVVVNGAQTTAEAQTTGSILLGALPARVVTGAQTLAAVTTAGTIDGGGEPVEPPVELPGGGGGSRAYRRRLREAREGRRVFEEEREKRIAALGVVIERPPLVPAPETVTMINRVLYEPIVRPIEVEPAPQQEFEDDGGEEELLLLLSAA